ncbi:dihydrofolate reductase family protein [Kribbella shirazensis]|jgi:dihydrofolate reductase|uniref:Dihydrofolate reductase n=1 Tax=Kribbella shirazensis TaxID=1105143 RepID=A0A7X5V5L5_9ACTN|nr:dihydrofolate reductase family protein [Kribbella shirazensis]NIK55020.1 dihydrofolate reductase [Kribbella shirazensis]
MRNIVARLCMSEDGIVERPEQWLPRQALGQLMPGSGSVLFGRLTFERYAGSLGTLENTRNLVVGSRPVIARPGTELLQGDTRRVLTALKSVPGEDLHVIGSLTLVRSLLRWRLVDEMSLLIHPVAAGRGTLLDRRQLRLISMCARDGGVLEANYRVRYAATAAPSAALMSTGRWGGTRSRDRVASTPRTAVRTHA